MTARLDEDLLVAVIDEVIYRLDAHGLRCAPDAAGRWSCAVTVDV